MKTAFHTAAVGAGSHQAKMSVLANNMANVSTTGYKSKNATFADLMYTDMEADPGRGRKGHSVRLDKTDSMIRQEGALEQTGGIYDFAIQGDGFFALLNPNTDQVVYTRSGRFDLSNQDGVFYLTDPLGRQVLDKDESPIEFFQDEEEDSMALTDRIGIYKVPIVDGMYSDGMSAYGVTEKNGEIYAQDGSEEGAVSILRQGMLESSNVDLTKEMAQIIETQRAYQMALKMVQTSDELEQLENELRR